MYLGIWRYLSCLRKESSGKYILDHHLTNVHHCKFFSLKKWQTVINECQKDTQTKVPDVATKCCLAVFNVLYFCWLLYIYVKQFWGFLFRPWKFHGWNLKICQLVFKEYMQSSYKPPAVASSCFPFWGPIMSHGICSAFISSAIKTHPVLTMQCKKRCQNSWPLTPSKRFRMCGALPSKAMIIQCFLLVVFVGFLRTVP